MKLLTSILLLLSMLFTACGTVEHPGRQIRFWVLDGKFTSLIIDGEDPNEQVQNWEMNFDPAETQVLTEGVWWMGTVVLLFNVEGVGERSCIIDNIRESSGEQFVDVIYTEGMGCTGDGGSAREPIPVQVLYDFFEGRDGYDLVEAAGFAVDSVECLEGIVEALATNAKFKVIRACGSAVQTGAEETAKNAVDTITKINEILSRSKDLQIADQPITNDNSVPPSEETTSQLASISFGPHVPILTYDLAEWEESVLEGLGEPILLHRNLGCRLDAFGGIGGEFPNAVTYTAKIGSIDWIVSRLDTLGPVIYGTNPEGPYNISSIVYNMQVGNHPDECMKAAEVILLLSEESIKKFIAS